MLAQIISELDPWLSIYKDIIEISDKWDWKNIAYMAIIMDDQKGWLVGVDRKKRATDYDLGIKVAVEIGNSKQRLIVIYMISELLQE